MQLRMLCPRREACGGGSRRTTPAARRDQPAPGGTEPELLASSATPGSKAGTAGRSALGPQHRHRSMTAVAVPSAAPAAGGREHKGLPAHRGSSQRAETARCRRSRLKAAASPTSPIDESIDVDGIDDLEGFSLAVENWHNMQPPYPTSPTRGATSTCATSGACTCCSTRSSTSAYSVTRSIPPTWTLNCTPASEPCPAAPPAGAAALTLGDGCATGCAEIRQGRRTGAGLSRGWPSDAGFRGG